MYKLMYEGIMRKVFGFNRTIIEPDEENNYLQTNLNIKNLKLKKLGKMKSWKSSTMTFWM